MNLDEARAEADAANKLVKRLEAEEREAMAEKERRHIEWVASETMAFADHPAFEPLYLDYGKRLLLGDRWKSGADKRAAQLSVCRQLVNMSSVLNCQPIDILNLWNKNAAATKGE